MWRFGLCCREVLKLRKGEWRWLIDSWARTNAKHMLGHFLILCWNDWNDRSFGFQMVPQDVSPLFSVVNCIIYVCVSLLLVGCQCCRTVRRRPLTRRWEEISSTSRTAGSKNSPEPSSLSFDTCQATRPAPTVELQVSQALLLMIAVEYDIV